METIFLYAVLSFTFGWGDSETGFQASVMTNQPSMKTCRLAAEDFLATYKDGNIRPGKEPDHGNIRCVRYINDERVEQVILYKK